MAEKIKIVYIINSFVLGGAEKMLLNLCQSMDKEKFEIAVCSVLGGGILEKELAKTGATVKIFQKKTKLGLGVIFQIYKFLKEYQPQIVHTHLFAADFWGKIAALLAGVPIIITTEHSVNLDDNWAKQKAKLLVSHFTAKIVAVSQAVKDFYVKKIKIAENKIMVIYNGIDTKRFIFRNFRPIDLDKKINAIVVARLAEVKGHKYLLSAMPLILEKYPNFILNIVGDGPERKDLENLVRDLNVSDNVLFSGENLAPENLFPQMDLFILPSLWEGLGIALLEAQSAGLPVLTSNIPGTIEVVKDGETGLLFEPKNSQAIFESIDRLLANPLLQEKIVNNARQQAVEKFDLRQMSAAYADLYFSFLESFFGRE